MLKCIDLTPRRDVVELKVTRESKDQPVPMDPPDPLVPPVAMDVTEKRDIPDQEDLPATLYVVALLD